MNILENGGQGMISSARMIFGYASLAMFAILTMLAMLAVLDIAMLF